MRTIHGFLWLALMSFLVETQSFRYFSTTPVTSRSLITTHREMKTSSSRQSALTRGMKQLMKGFRSFTAGLGILAGGAMLQSSTSTLSPVFADAVPAVGQVAPDFSLPSSLGKEISLNDLKGKRTVLYFYPADYSSGCTLEAQTFERDLKKYQALDTQIVGVSVDSIDKHLGFSKKCGLEFPLLSDSGGIVSFKYGSLFDFGFMGKFSNRQTYIISPDLKIEYVFTDVDSHVPQHSSEVLAKLQEIQTKAA